MSKTINFDKYLKAVDTPTFEKDGVVYKTKPISVTSAARLMKMMQTVENDPTQLTEFTQEFANAVGVPSDLFSDLPAEVFVQVLGDFFMEVTNEPTPKP